ncbi:hypothetical protein AB0K00_55520 [Dactylosporangium sp. NPDC049525]|uniref:hypothetical protein n=1 Tax=Dactylosporangium sp. NPDC049525 TaxID=3154730 RepID=UPI0034197609
MSDNSDLVTLLAAAAAGLTLHAGRDLLAGHAAVLGTGWAGVAWRIGRWSVLVESTLWRASSTLTYANAAAAVLAVTALLALALTLDAPGGWWRSCGAYLSLAGLAATLSRAGALAFVAGLLVLAAAAGVRAVLRQAAPAVLGAVIALAALIPSFPAGAEPRPLLAVGGLLTGGAVAVLAPRLRGRALLAAWTALAAAPPAGTSPRRRASPRPAAASPPAARTTRPRRPAPARRRR